MSRISALLSLALFLIVPGGCATTGGGGGTDMIRGLVLSPADQEDQPVELVRVNIWPEGDPGLVGTGTTNSAGRFTIAGLARRGGDEVGLVRDAGYEIQIVDSSHYILRQRFDYATGAADWIFVVEPKDYGVDEDAPTVADDLQGEERAAETVGSVRRATR
ncbi:MAG: hypothetical protein VX498_11555 [Myxococcota bacterium]|nr:hypothetical protein [Myxococcota bacterium]